MVTRVSVVTLMCLVVVGPDTRAAQAPMAAAPCPEMASALTALMRNDARLRDWPNLARYREDNRTLPAGNGARVVFMGDSITDAWQQPRYGGFFPGKPYVDRGISGQTTPQMLLRFRPDVIDLEPKVVVILAGTNDIAGNTGPMTNEEIEGNIASMSELAHAHKIRVVLASVTPVSGYHVASSAAVPQTTLRPMARVQAGGLLCDDLPHDGRPGSRPPASAALRGPRAENGRVGIAW